MNFNLLHEGFRRKNRQLMRFAEIKKSIIFAFWKKLRAFRGDKSPLLHFKKMIERNRIEELIDQKLEGTELFLVELKINIANKIDVFIDGMKGVTIKDCVGISRHIESSLDREEQDFELNVSSPGAEESFKVLKQYEKNIGRKLIVSTHDGITQEGILIEANFLEIKIEKTEKRKKESGKGNILVKEIIRLELAKVKQARVILSFK